MFQLDNIKKKWEDEEIQILKDNYPNILIGELVNLLPNRTIKAIKRRAERFELKRNVDIKFKQMSLATRKKWKNGKFPKIQKNICELCGIEFSGYHSKNRKFCSQKCFHNYCIGKNHPNWRGGISTYEYTKEFNNSLKRYIAMRDNYTCQICGRKLEENENYFFDVHHIDYDKTNSNEENLIYLCRACHSKTNYNREIWEKQLSTYIKEKKYNFPKIVSKVWGEEIWICNKFKYCGKILTLKKGFRCSLHTHKIKDESFYILDGKVLMEVGTEIQTMKEGDVVHILPKVYHRFTGLEDSRIIEISTLHFDSDSYRKELSGKVK